MMQNLKTKYRDRKTLKILEHLFQAAVLAALISTGFFYIQESYVFAIVTLGIYSTVLPVAIALTLINLYLKRLNPSGMMESLTGVMQNMSEGTEDSKQ